MAIQKKTPPKKSAPKQSRAEQEYAKLQHEADVRLQHLRSVLKDVTRAYVANIEQKILAVADKIGAPSPTAKGNKIPSGQLMQIIQVLDEVKIKHEKGRRKDMKKIEILIETISSYIPSEEA
jgi:hypothetical protein